MGADVSVVCRRFLFELCPREPVWDSDDPTKIGRFGKQEVSVILESQDLWDLTDTTVSMTDLKDEGLKAHRKKEGKAKVILRTNIS
jgi:hypothetical protein